MIRALIPVALALAIPGVAHAGCAEMRSARVANVTILDASEIPAGEFRPAPRYGMQPPAIPLAAHCRIRGVATPVRGSRIGFELWLPLSGGWNQRLRMFGNGGYSSSMPLERLADAVNGGYAAVATDTGHDGDDPDFAVGRPQSIDDWGHRAVHATAVAAKSLARAFYGAPVRHSYFDGCSTGGHQALMEAQRYPEDFDGIVAGAPGNNRVALNIGFLWQFVANHRPDGSVILPPSKLHLLTDHALERCGSAAERQQGYLENPFACRPEPAALQCRPGQDRSECLTADEAAAAARLYAGARNPRTGAQLYPAWLPGSESFGPPGMPLPGWSLYWADPQRPAQPARSSFWRFWAFGNPAWDWRSFDFDHDVARLAALSRRIDAIDPDLRRFRAAGGKLIQYHGLIDPVVSPWDSRNYYDSVAHRTGGGTDRFYRLFFLPGVAHCAGGPGATPSDLQGQIEAWAERGIAPDRLKAERNGAPAAPLEPYIAEPRQ